MKQPIDIVIVGAGMVGLAIANLLGKSDLANVTVIDAGKKPIFSLEDDLSLRVSAIAPGSAELLRAIGVWDEIATERACPYRDMRVWDAAGHADGPETVAFSAAEFAAPQLGFIVENILVRTALLNKVAQTNVATRFETTIKSMRKSSNRYELELDSGRTLAPELVIGADGARSFIRDAAAIEIDSWPHEQKAFVTHLMPELDHRNTAWQRFLTDGPLGILPLHDGRVSIVWSTTPENADDALAMTDEQLASRLTEISGGVLGRLTPSGDRGAFPLESQHAKHYVTPGLALVGDAAHAIHPLAGQGVNLGFADAIKLAEVLVSALEGGEFIGDRPVLRKYERARKGDNQLMLNFVRGLNKLFSAEYSSLQPLRGAGMAAFNKSGPLREHAVRVALGLG
ncbi:MAG: UbiH/UbiF/VisC/COQ6 family ubiquinone biosynthesis hydroxylase [Woeseiaceae bacterium]|jgi:2-octaprenylphenol hydroxylase|nr:UbiH/UbiF/VisC/COQ6 family ubiquinone biosynthesis hydroxylase [Woeseiaceae bacterium]